MKLILEGPLTCEHMLRTDLGEDDIGRTWWIGTTWYIWTGAEGRWQKAMVARRPRNRHRKRRSAAP